MPLLRSICQITEFIKTHLSLYAAASSTCAAALDADAPRLILKKRGSPLQITIENWQQLKEGATVPLHLCNLASHPG